MIIAIIAGGSGTRLWPLSTPQTPKQLLQLTTNRTMVQQAYDRAKQLSDDIYIITEASHADAIKSQLPELNEEAFLVEPARRGTAHCILFALDYIARRHDNDQPIAFIHSDHHIRDTKGFARSFGVASEISHQRQNIALIGIEPSFPSVSFGYIERDDNINNSNNIFNVKSFKEKPDYQTAVDYVESGNYLWNCGYFVGSVNVFKKTMAECASQLLDTFDNFTKQQLFSKEYEDLYLALDNQVIDVALIEKAKDLIVVSADFDWMDVGTFKDLHEVVPKDEENNYQKGENIHTDEVANSYIRNEEPQKPVAVIGLDNIVVVNTPDGILVARKDISSRCGEIAKKINQ